MRLVMFCPVVEQSAIGRVTAVLTRLLVERGHDVTVVRTEMEPHLSGRVGHLFDAPIIAWNDTAAVIAAMSARDIAVYQIGDHFGFHGGAVEWLREHPGIVCLHDNFIGNLFSGWSQEHAIAARAELVAWYGTDVAEAVQRAVCTPDFIKHTAGTAPMTEWVCSMALGVLTHSRWGLDRVSRSCAGPISVAPLLTAARPRAARSASRERRAFRVLTVGHVNANKRVAAVIRALAAGPRLRRMAEYHVVGHVTTAARVELTQFADDLGVSILFTGEVGDEAFADALARADVVCCLRRPALEAASASAVEALVFGKPTVVSDTGFYRELPDDVVVKIPDDDEIEPLRIALENLLADPVELAALGARAAAYAAETFTADAHADALVQLAEDAIAGGPVLRVAHSAAITLAQWGMADSLATEARLRGALALVATPRRVEA